MLGGEGFGFFAGVAFECSLQRFCALVPRGSAEPDPDPLIVAAAVLEGSLRSDPPDPGS